MGSLPAGQRRIRTGGEAKQPTVDVVDKQVKPSKQVVETKDDAIRKDLKQKYTKIKQSVSNPQINSKPVTKKEDEK
jgi:hypothetical protein